MTRTIVTAIVSTAAPGAERGALDAAIELDIGYGGRTALPITPEMMPAIYVARCAPVRNRDLAVRLNVQDSDGTLIVSFADALTGRCKHAADQCKAQRKPCQHLILQAGASSRITEAVRTGLLRWIDERHISVLHVVGPSEEQEPGIQQATYEALVWVLEDDAAVDVLPGMPDAAAVVSAVCDHGISKAGDVLMARYPEAARRFADVDRTAAPESLQHVAAPLDVEQAIRLGIRRIRDTEERLDPATMFPDMVEVVERVQIGADGNPDQSTYSLEVLGPATRADLDDLDAVPEPVDSDAPPSTYLPGAAPIGPTAQTRPYRRERHITGPDGVPRPESEDEERMHARTLARARK